MSEHRSFQLTSSTSTPKPPNKIQFYFGLFALLAIAGIVGVCAVIRAQTHQSTAAANSDIRHVGANAAPFWYYPSGSSSTAPLAPGTSLRYAASSHLGGNGGSQTIYAVTSGPETGSLVVISESDLAPQ